MYVEARGPKQDQEFLDQHRAIRRRRGWGRGLEQTFYSAADLDSALALGIKDGHLSKEEAQTERQALAHFQKRGEQLKGLTSKPGDLGRAARKALSAVQGK